MVLLKVSKGHNRIRRTSRARKLRTFTGTVEQYCDALDLSSTAVRHQRVDEIADNITYGESKELS